MDEDEVSPEAEFLWEWRQKMLPFKFMFLLGMFFCPLYIHRFYLKQWMEGIVLLFIHWSCVFIYFNGRTIALIVPAGIMLYEWTTIRKRTKAYNIELEKALKKKWNVASNYRI